MRWPSGQCASGIGQTRNPCLREERRAVAALEASLDADDALRNDAAEPVAVEVELDLEAGRQRRGPAARAAVRDVAGAAAALRHRPETHALAVRRAHVEQLRRFRPDPVVGKHERRNALDVRYSTGQGSGGDDRLAVEQLAVLVVEGERHGPGRDGALHVRMR